MIHPNLDEVPPFYQGYVSLVKDLDLYVALQRASQQMIGVLATIPEEKGTYRYAEGKWSVKELLCHLMDAEWVFAYRALRFARNDKTPLAGFEEKDYAPQANAHSRSVVELGDEMSRLRASTIDLFKSFSPEMLQRTGIANGTTVSVVNLGFIIAGHETHHRAIIEERYLAP
jgi:uncharacterized damage-inducible protein DinB